MAYGDLITSEHADKPNFVSTISAITDPFVGMQLVYKKFPEAYDIDVAVGNQLDAIGEWVGRSRFVDQPILGVFFSWNDSASTGWGQGVWKGKFDSATGLTRLPDDFYRKLLKAKIAANHWDGTMESMPLVWSNIFPNSNVIIQDNHDMSYSILITGAELTSLDKALLTQGYIPLKPSTVRIRDYYVSTSSAPVFGWNCDYTKGTFGGWGTGEWASKL